MDRSRQSTRRRFGTWGMATAAAVVLAVGGVGGSAYGYSGPPDFQAIGGGVGTTVPNGTGSVYASIVVGTTVYIGGDFQLAGGAAIGPVAQWTGSAWADVGTPADAPSGVVQSMTTDGTDLYVGGDFGVFEYAPATDTWTDLNWPNIAMALAWYDDGVHPAHLVAAGERVATPGCRFGSFESSSWTTVTGFAHPSQDCGLYALAVMDHVLYVGGIFTSKSAVSANNLIAYDGTTNTWSGVAGATGNGVSDQADTGNVFALAVDSATSTLFIGGSFSDASGTAVNSIASYHAGAFSDIAGAATQFGASTEVDSLALAHLGGTTMVLAGGQFNMTGLTTSLVSTSVEAASWSTAGQVTDGFIDTILVLSPTELILGGEFATAYSMYTTAPIADTMGVVQFAPSPIPPTWNPPVVVAGTPKVGNVLTAPHDLNGDPIPTLTYQWIRCAARLQLDQHRPITRGWTPPAGCIEIPGATKQTYTLTTADVGTYVGVAVWASNIAGPGFMLVSAAVAVPAVPSITTTTTTTTPATTPTSAPTSEPTLPATGSSPTMPWLAFGLTGVGMALLVPARRRWLR